jgi:hypothetical protein
MTSQALNAPVDAFPVLSKWVWFTGATALSEGQGLCYDYDRGTAANADAKRMNFVELPSITNARYFAGVAARSYAAVSGGQFIEIYLPGSACNILAMVSATLGSGILTCEAGGTYAGYFRYAGFEGEGSAVPLQTVDRSVTAGKVFALLQAGIPSGLVEAVTPEAAGGAHTFMVGGVTIFDTAVTLAANATFTLADSTIPGQKKMFKCAAAMTTSDIVVTVTSGKKGMGDADPTGTLATVTMDADNEEISLEWFGGDAGGHWYCTGVLGTVIG